MGPPTSRRTSRRAAHEHLAPRPGPDRRPDRRRLRHRSGCVHRRGRRHRRPGQGPERGARLPRRDGRGRRLHRPQRDPDQRPLPARDHRRRASSPGPTTGRSSPITLAPRLLDRRRAPSSSPARRGPVRHGRRRRRRDADVPDHALVAGNPARRIGWVCACGQRLGSTRRRARSPPSTDGDATCCARVRRVDVPDRRRARCRRPRREAAPHDPDLAAGHRRRRGGGRPRGPPLADARDGPGTTEPSRQAWAAYCGVRHAIFMANGTRRPGGGPARRSGSARATRSSRSASRSTRP